MWSEREKYELRSSERERGRREWESWEKSHKQWSNDMQWKHYYMRFTAIRKNVRRDANAPIVIWTNEWMNGMEWNGSEQNMLTYYDLHKRLNEIWDIGEKYIKNVRCDSWLCVLGIVKSHHPKESHRQRCWQRWQWQHEDKHEFRARNFFHYFLSSI